MVYNEINDDLVSFMYKNNDLLILLGVFNVNINKVGWVLVKSCVNNVIVGGFRY